MQQQRKGAPYRKHRGEVRGRGRQKAKLRDKGVSDVLARKGSVYIKEKQKK